MDAEHRTDQPDPELDADERATRLLIRLGVAALVLLALWIGIVLVGFL